METLQENRILEIQRYLGSCRELSIPCSVLYTLYCREVGHHSKVMEPTLGRL